MEYLDLFSPSLNLIADRQPLPPLGRRHHAAGLALWLITGVLALIMALFTGLRTETPFDLFFFGLLIVLAILMSASDPLNIHLSRLSTTMAIAAIGLGIPEAILLGLVAGAVGNLLLVPLRRFVGITQLKPINLIFAGLWNTGVVCIALIPAWLIYSLISPNLSTAMDSVANFLAYLVFASVYFAGLVALIAVWMRLRGVALRTYLTPRALRELAANSLLVMVFVPLIVMVYRQWPNLWWLILIAYVIGGALFYSTNQAYKTLATRLAELRVINRIGQALNTNLNLDTLIETIYREVSGLMDTSGMYVALYDQERSMVRFPLMYLRGERVQFPERVFSKGLTEYVITTRRPLRINRNVNDEARKLGIIPVGESPLSYVGVPIMAGDTVLGVLGLRDFYHANAYRKSDVQLLETIAAQAGVAIANAQLFIRSQRQSGELTALHKVSLTTSASEGLRDVLRVICAEAVRVMPFEKIGIFLLDEDGSHLSMVESAGLSDKYVDWSQNIDVQASSRTTVLHMGKPMAVSSIEADGRFGDFIQIAREEGFAAFLDLPLYSSNKLIGSLTAYYEHPHDFEDGEIELMQTLGGQIAIAVENARLFEQMRARTREMETLYDASTVINASLSLKNVLRAAAISMLQALETKSCIALVSMEDRQELRAELFMLQGAEGILDDHTDNFSVMLDELPHVQMAVRRLQPVVIKLSQSLSAGERLLLEKAAAQSAIVVPLVARGQQLVGLIMTGTPDGNHVYSAGELRLADALANQAAVAIENAVLFERTDIALARRLDEIQSLELISQRMTRRLDVQSVIEHVMQAAKAATASEFGEVALYDENRNMLSVATRLFAPEDVAQNVEMEWPASRGLSGRVIQTGQPALVDDVLTDPEYHAARHNVRSEMIIPIIQEGRRLGIINLESTRIAAYNMDHLRFVQSLAEHAAIAIQNARLFEAIQRRADEFNTLRGIAVDLLSTSDKSMALRIVARGAMERTHAQNVHIYLYDDKNHTLTFGTSIWSNGMPDREVTPPRSNGLTMTVARTGERIVIANTRTHPLFMNAAAVENWDQRAVDGMRSIIGVPLKRGNRVVGVFNVAFDDPTHITDDLLRFLEFLAAQAAVAIANAELQEETRTGRDLLQAILDSSHDGIMMVDNNQRLVMANARLEYLLNVHLQDSIGKPFIRIMRRLVDVFGHKNEFMNDDAHGATRRIRQNPSEITRRRYTLNIPAFRAIEETSLPVFGHNDELLGRMFILRDTTQEYELESFRQEMSHMLVHDLRSPLGGVITGVHTAMDEIQTGMENQTEPDLNMVQVMLGVSLSSARSLLGLVESILDIHKMETGEMPLHLDNISLMGLAEHARTTLEQTAREAGITVTVDAPPDLPAVRADGEKIERVMINLLDNALRYTPQNGNVWITVDCTDAAQTVTIRDSGEGIPPDMWDRIFERFVQADTSRRKRGSKGSGLGLTFCKLAVEAHGGHIWVDRGQEGGAAFHFSLPM